ncbi:MAG: hypothetical protein JKX74_07980 [Flavobacteriales bacterium]|nr:hypothetical protein [Flavobacteriales bacterium]
MLITIITNRVREKRDRYFTQLSNLKDQYFVQYLSEEIKKARKELTKKKDGDLIISIDKPENVKRISRVLNRVGTLAFTGGLPLNVILLLNSYGFLIDWNIIIANLNQSSNKPTYDSDERYWNYCFSEWLALVGWIWIKKSKYVTDTYRDKVFSNIEKYYKNEKNIRKREKIIRMQNADMVSPITEAVVRRIRRRKWFGF